MAHAIDVTRGSAAGELIVRDGERMSRMFAVVAGGVTWVFDNGHVHRLETGGATRRAPQTHGSLSSPMPATVIRVEVAPGDAVVAGQTLLVLEAMKMELPVRAPGAGEVRAVHCKPGDLVQPDVSLIDFA
jgi:biotin carboxyl carrier protein